MFLAFDWYAVPFASECEDLIRSMLVVDGKHRITMEQIINHKWMHPVGEEEEDRQFQALLRQYCADPSQSPGVGNAEEEVEEALQEQVLGFMTNLGLDRKHTLEVTFCYFVCVVKKSFVHLELLAEIKNSWLRMLGTVGWSGFFFSKPA